MHGGHVQVLALEDKLREPVQALGLRAARRRHRDAVLDPVDILAVAKAGQVLGIIGRIVVCDEQAPAVEALDEHTLTVHVREAERAVHLIAPLLARPALDRAEQRRRDLGIVHEVHLAEAHAVRAELVIGLVTEDRTDAADDLPVAPGQPAARLAVVERRVLARRPVGEVIPVERGNVVRIIGIEPVGILHKLAQLVLGRDLSHDDRAVLFKLLHENVLLTTTMTSGNLAGDSIARLSPDFNLCVCGYSPNQRRSTRKIPRSGRSGGPFFPVSAYRSSGYHLSIASTIAAALPSLQISKMSDARPRPQWTNAFAFMLLYPFLDVPPPHTHFGAGWLVAIPVTGLFYRLCTGCQADKLRHVRNSPTAFLARS